MYLLRRQNTLSTILTTFCQEVALRSPLLLFWDSLRYLNLNTWPQTNTESGAVSLPANHHEYAAFTWKWEKISWQQWLMFILRTDQLFSLLWLKRSKWSIQNLFYIPVNNLLPQLLQSFSLCRTGDFSSVSITSYPLYYYGADWKCMGNKKRNTL